MQRIKSVRWPARNIGGDRAYCKLRYVKGAEFPITLGQYYTAQNQAMAIGASAAGALSSCTLTGVMGHTPHLSTMGALYTKYRIRGIKLRLSYWQTGGAPVFLFAQATPDQGVVGGGDTAPNPDFILPSINQLPEQRWAKYRVCQATAAGGRATNLSVYYSVNRVQGPDAIVKNDLEYTGDVLLVCDFVFCVVRCCYFFFVVVISFLHRLCVQVVCFCFGDVQWCNVACARLERS